MLRDEVKLFEKLSGESANDVTIERLGSFLDGYFIGKEETVKHAHWKIIYESSAGVTDAKCSNCGYESLAYENDVHTDKDCHYCPCCGAKMDGEVESYKEVGKRMADGFAKGFENNVRSVGQQFCNDEE